MPIQIKIVDKKPMFRWGSQGTWFPTRKQAEEQARAAYASGYKEKSDKNK